MRRVMILALLPVVQVAAAQALAPLLAHTILVRGLAERELDPEK